MESRLAQVFKLYPWVPRTFSCQPASAALSDVAESKQLCSAQPPVASPWTPTHSHRQGYLRAAPLSPGHRGGARMKSPSLHRLSGCPPCCRSHPARQGGNYPDHDWPSEQEKHRNQSCVSVKSKTLLAADRPGLQLWLCVTSGK